MRDTKLTPAGGERTRLIVPEGGSALLSPPARPSTRKRFLGMVGGTGATGALALLAASCGGDDGEETGETAPEEETGAAGRDLDVLNFALTLEFLEARFYGDVTDSGVIDDENLAQMISSFGEQEAEHVDAITAAIEQMGGTPADEPEADFRSVIEGGAEMVLSVAARIENVGAAAYLNEAVRAGTPEVLAATLSIHTVEARHAAALNDAAGLGFTGEDQFEGTIPDGAFATPAEREIVLREIEPFLPTGAGAAQGDGGDQ